MKNKRLIIILSTIAGLLLIPFIGMQFSNEIDWTLSDFLIMAALMFSSGIACEIVLRKVPKMQYRLAICIGIIAVFLLIWAELAVGIFGTAFAGS